MPAVLTRQARRDLAIALARIAEDNPDAAECLNDAVREAARLIGACRPRLASTRYRFWSIPRYRYLLADTNATDPPRIVRIVHTARDLPRVLAELLD